MPLRARVALARARRRLGTPVTFNEKVRYKMLWERRPLLTTFADKLAVREYVSSRVGPQILPELHLVTSSPEAVVESELPREFVVKPSHASGACVVVAGFAPPEHELPPTSSGWTETLVRPERLDRGRLAELCRHWLARRYGRGQWCYLGVPRRVLVEELLGDGTRIPLDYKLSVFHGSVRLIQVDSDRFQCHRRSLYTPSWERLPGRFQKYELTPDVERPPRLAEMVEIAEALATETDFVRVDLYAIGERIVFGELTNYPEAGNAPLVPAGFDREVGEWWTPPRRYAASRGVRSRLRL